MINASAADTMIVFYDENWWLCSNIDSSPGGEHRSHLHFFVAQIR